MTSMYRRNSIDSGISIRSAECDEKHPVVILKSEKNFKRPSTIRISSRNWSILAEQPSIISSSAHAVHLSSLSNLSTLSSTARDSWTRQSQLSYWNSKFSKKQNLHCIIIGLLICILISVALGLTLHFQNSEADFDGTRGPTGSVPGQLPGPILPVLGVASFGGNASGVYFGVSIDWKIDDPANFNSKLEYPAAIHDSIFYLGDIFNTQGIVNSSGILHSDPDIYLWTARLVRGTGAIMGITLIPVVGLSKISNGTLYEVAQKCREINQMGVPILLRFGPEMNGILNLMAGNWFPYGQDPSNFINSFRKLSGYVTNATNNTAMVWSPVSSLGYPFGRGYFFPNRTSSSYSLLDTNFDGLLDGKDDGYTPFYPGDEYVDWVGLSIYYSSSIRVYQGETFASHADASPTMTSRPISKPTPKFPIINLPPSSPEMVASQLSRGSLDFYTTFGSSKKKPVLIVTGAAYLRGDLVVDLASEAAIKTGWCDQLLNRTFLLGHPYIRGLVISDYTLPVNQSNSSAADFTISANETILGYYRKSISMLISANNSNERSVLALASALNFTEVTRSSLKTNGTITGM